MARFLWLAFVLAGVPTCLWPAVVLAPAAKKPPAGQIRALWVDGFNPGIRTPQETDQLIADAVAAHLNLLIVQVRRRGDSFYAKSLEPPAEEEPYRADFDALGYLLEKAHAAGLQVHAWMNVTPIWRARPDPPRDPRHIFNVHGLTAQGADDWLTQTISGEKKFSVGYFLDPGHPAAATHIVGTILHVVRNYPVDGIHLDYVRYPETTGVTESSGSPAGYNPVSVERFHKRYGGTGLPATNDPRWSDWRREQVTNLVRRIHFGIQEIRPGVALSAALIPWGDGPRQRKDFPHSHPYWRVFQDWLLWLDAGIIDMAIPMNYVRQSEARTRVFFEHWIELEKNHKKDRHMAVGLGAYLNTAEQSQAQLRRAQARSRQKKSADGFAIYSYANNARNGGLGLLALLAKQDIPTPPLPARPVATEGSISGTVAEGDGTVVEISRKGSKPQRVIADGNGFFGATRLRPGAYRVTAGEKSVQVDVEAGKVTIATF